MSRNNSGKKPKGFALHITAGGVAGACEAVSSRLRSVHSHLLMAWVEVNLPAFGHYQSADAALQIRQSAWCAS